ncbi:MAG TPA: glutaredoxin-related protein [Candidatus Barnesiella merdipullorum]|nr:glutaredoxin-related protein [Candidatus Barnesiella merdipullorum]
MIKIYGMSTCPDCTFVEAQVKGDSRYEIIDIGQHVKNLKAFLRLRDTHPAFDGAKRVGAVGIPCFVLDDGTVTLIAEEAGLHSRPTTDGAACNLDGSGC